MALISMRQMLDHAAEFGYGVPAFNVNNLEQMRAIMEAADKTDSPVIVQASAGARKYAGAPFLRHLILAAIEEFPHIPVVMHQDHGTSPDVCQRSIQLGFSSVMMDGSLREDGKTPADYDYNVRVTQQTVAFAHACGVSVEGELGCLGSLETGMAGEEDGVGAEGVLDHSQLLTDPEEAADFVKKTKVDALAIAIGTSHGAYKFTKPPTGDTLSIQRIKEIHARIPDTHLVMHGSSSVPQDWLAIINEYGGEIKETYGVPVEEIVEGIKHLHRSLRSLRHRRQRFQDQADLPGRHVPALRSRRAGSEGQLSAFVRTGAPLVGALAHPPRGNPMRRWLLTLPFLLLAGCAGLHAPSRDVEEAASPSVARDPADPQDCLARSDCTTKTSRTLLFVFDYAEAGGELVVRDGRRLETPPAPQRSTWPALRIQLAEPVNGRFEFESPCLRKSGKGCRYSQATLLKVYRSYLVGKPCSLLSPRAVKRCVDPATTAARR